MAKIKHTTKMFVAISGILGSRVTASNFRTAIRDINSAKGITGKDKTRIIVEILATLVEMDR